MTAILFTGTCPIAAKSSSRSLLTDWIPPVVNAEQQRHEAKKENRAHSVDSLKACSKPRAFNCPLCKNKELPIGLVHVGIKQPGGFQPGGRDPQRGCEPFLEVSWVDILYTTALHFLCSILDGGRWVIVGCYNGSWYKKRLKTTEIT